jgi:superfamily II DNA or RNA helicase
VSDLLRLRDYQSATIRALHTRWDAGDRRVAAVLPTGAGKTVVFSHLSSGFVADNPGRRVLILAHTDELVSQAVKKLRDVAPHLRVGVVKASRNDVRAQVIVASVQSLRSEKRRRQIRNVGLVIVDECHHAAATTYRKILEHYGCFLDQDPVAARLGIDPILVAGFTATLARGDKLSLADVWQSVAYRKDIAFMIRAGYLLDLTGRRVEVDDLDLKNVKRSGGDYQAASLGEAMTASLAPEIVARAYLEHAPDRSGVLFAPTVSAAQAFAGALDDLGVKTEVVHGGMPVTERRAIIARFEAGVTQVISNCMVLTEGFDSPRASCVVIARPTRSAPLYQQMVGRALRPYPGQTQALVLDVVGASQVHGLASLIDLSEKPITLKPDQSFLDAVDELEEAEPEEPGARPKLVHRGPVKVVEFDPLARDSKRVWMATHGGHYFLSAGTGKGAVYVFLIPAGGDAEPGTWDVAWCTKDPYDAVDGKRGDVTEHRGVSLDAAFAWGEDLALELSSKSLFAVNTLSKAVQWRKELPSQSQRDYARRLRISDRITEGMSKGDVARLIDVEVGSRRIDPIPALLQSLTSR